MIILWPYFLPSWPHVLQKSVDCRSLFNAHTLRVLSKCEHWSMRDFAYGSKTWSPSCLGVCAPGALQVQLRTNNDLSKLHFISCRPVELWCAALIKWTVICPLLYIIGWTQQSGLQFCRKLCWIPGRGCSAPSFSHLLIFLFSLWLTAHITLHLLVSSKMFLPLTNFKYSLHVLSTIAYKHLEIIESQWAD